MTVVGWVLIGGFVSFMIGASRWRVEYEQPLELALPIMHADRARMRSIHVWMLPALFLTPAGLGGLAVLSGEPGVALASTAYTVGAVLWAGTLVFRLSVGEWAAERTSVDGRVPDIYPPFARMAGFGHFAHMLSAYLTAVPLGWAAAGADLIPDWLAWAGSIWGGALAVLFLIPVTRFVAAPPFWAHTFTLAVGIALLV